MPVLKVQNLLQSSGNSAKHHPALLNVLTDEEADDSVHAFKELEFPTPPAHPIHLPSSYSFRDRSDSSARNSSSFAQAPVSTSLPLNEVDRSETRTVEESKTTEPAQTSYEFPAEPSQEVFYSSNPPVTAHPLQIDAQPLAIVRYMRLLVRYSPQPLSSMFARVEPAINKWAHALHFLFLTVYILLEILLELSIEAYTALKPYRPELLFPSFAGLVMCFFGGSFVTTIAAAEAYRLVGYETTLQCVRSLMEDFQNVLEAAEKDAALGIDDVEPAMQDMQDSESSKQPDRFDIWSDLRQETVGVRSEKMRQNRGMSVDEGEEGSENHSAVYCDGTEMLGEEHDHVGLAAGLEGLAHPHRPHVHTTPVKKTVASATAVTATTSANTATGASAGSRMSTRSSSRKGGVPVENGVPVVRQTTTSKLRKKRRSMFDAHSDGLDAFRASVLEQRTPAKSRPSLLGAPTSSPAGLSGAGAGDTGACAGAGSNGDNSGNNVSSQPISAVAVPSPPPHLRQAKRSSLLTGSQSLEEYQREQEELGADTTASKALFFLQNVDPQRFTNAIVGINAGLVAVVATLKVQFAKTITLGSALSKAIDGPAKMVLKPLVELALPKPYKKWADVLLTYSIKSFAISIAWTLRRVVSSFHSAIRGGLMFSKNLLSYLVDMGVLKEHHINSAYVPYIDTVLGYSVALLGLWFQLSYGFALPFPLNIILFPFTILEYALVWMVNNSHYILGQY